MVLGVGEMVMRGIVILGVGEMVMVVYHGPGGRGDGNERHRDPGGRGDGNGCVSWS